MDFRFTEPHPAAAGLVVLAGGWGGKFAQPASRCGPATAGQVVATISQETLSEMVGTTRSRVNFFMNKFKKLGFIEYDGDLDKGIQINSSLLSVVLHD